METLELEVTRVRWRAPDGAFAVLDGLTDQGEAVCATGALAHVGEGESVGLRGAWREHERFGRQFQAEAVHLREPASEAALLGLLAAVRHVGPAGAAWLLECHGAAVLDVVDADPRARLGEVPGIGRARLGAAVRSWQEARALRAVRAFLDAHGVPARVAARVSHALGSTAVEALTEDPYRLTELDGVGFATADALAGALGAAPDAPGRLRAGVLHVLARAEGQGHCHLPRSELEARAERLLGTPVGDAVDELAASGRVVVDRAAGLVATPDLRAAEERVGARVRELLASPAAFGVDGLRPPSPPPRAGADAGAGAFAPSAEQWAAVAGALTHRLSILTGGPGVGKTATMRTLVEVARARGLRVRLCAPTGKAARRLAESTEAPATTVHRLLEWVPGEGPARGPDDPLAADVLVVDEASMLDLRLADALLAAVGPRTHVLLVGDPDQLAPVGPGRVLGDLLASERVPVTRLTEVFRQAARSLIVRAAHAINRGEHPPLHAPPDVRAPAGEARGSDDLYLVARERPEAIVEEVVALVARRLPAHLGLDPRADVQVLAPQHPGPVGVDALNAELRLVLNPTGASIPGSALRVGDRVVQTVNDHERGLMNGEVGVVADHDPARGRTVLVCDDGRRLALGAGALGTLRPAYALSVHKAQGGAAPAVVIPLFRGHAHMLTRNLVYTALTRAERLAVLVGHPEALSLALGRTDARRRHTRLAGLVGPGLGPDLPP